MYLNLGQWVSHYLNVSQLHQSDALCLSLKILLPTKPFLGKFNTCNENGLCTIIFSEKGESILKPGRLLTYFVLCFVEYSRVISHVVLNRKEIINANVISQKYCKIKKYIYTPIISQSLCCSSTKMNH